MSKWKISIFVIAIILLLVGGTLINYQGFKSNSDEQKEVLVEKEPNNEKPEAGDNRKKQDPVLELTQDSVEIEIGSIFNPVDYIKIAQDHYGYSAKDKVSTDAQIPTERPGKYEVIYTMNTSTDNGIEKILSVEVKEMK